MTQKYNCNNTKEAIFTQLNGFCFGRNVLLLTSGTTLNQHYQGYCLTGKGRQYDIEGDESPLTNQNNDFTCAQLEVYKVIYN